MYCRIKVSCTDKKKLGIVSHISENVIPNICMWSSHKLSFFLFYQCVFNLRCYLDLKSKVFPTLEKVYILFVLQNNSFSPLSKIWLAQHLPRKLFYANVQKCCRRNIRQSRGKLVAHSLFAWNVQIYWNRNAETRKYGVTVALWLPIKQCVIFFV
jgi:hypothetical protein